MAYNPLGEIFELSRKRSTPQGILCVWTLPTNAINLSCLVRCSDNVVIRFRLFHFCMHPGYSLLLQEIKTRTISCFNFLFTLLWKMLHHFTSLFHKNICYKISNLLFANLNSSKIFLIIKFNFIICLNENETIFRLSLLIHIPFE